MLKPQVIVRISTLFVGKKWYFNALFLQIVEKIVNNSSLASYFLKFVMLLINFCKNEKVTT